MVSMMIFLTCAALRFGNLERMSAAIPLTAGAAMEVPPEQTSSYGVLDVAEDMGALVKVGVLRDDREPVLGCMLPHGTIVRTL